MTYQLRMYKVKTGELKDWVEEWSEHIVPLRRHYGFEIVGSWTIDDEDRFVWILNYSGPKSWEDAEADYYGSPERKGLSPDPARHLASQEHWLMSPTA